MVEEHKTAIGHLHNVTKMSLIKSSIFKSTPETLKKMQEHLYGLHFPLPHF